MGIPSYFSHIVKQHRSIIRPFVQNKDIIDNLYLDCNSIIYDELHKLAEGVPYSQIENVLINAVISKLIYYINLIQPKQNVFVAFDGVAPVAKLDQQRKRRYMTWFQGELVKKLDPSVETAAKWNSSAITPGTSFMNELGRTLKMRFGNPGEFKLDKLIISSSDEAGEGEHKIYEFIRNNKDYHAKSSTVIYGLDADLIMLTLNHLHIAPKMYLFRETPHFISSIDKSLDPEKNYVMDIGELNSNISQEVNSASDYIFICFMLGNDFLPHFPALNIRTNGIYKLVDAYVSTMGKKNTLTTIDKNGSNKIIWKNYRKFIEYLALKEEDYIKEEFITREKQGKRGFNYNDYQGIKKLEKQIENVPMTDRSCEQYINPLVEGWRERYYSKLFNIRICEVRLKEICMNYLEGLEWTFKYYSTGCVNWRLSYKYHYPPLLSDLIKYIPYFDIELVEHKDKNPVNSMVQLCYVLPKSSHYLLPQKLYGKISKSVPHYYSNNCNFEWAFCKYFWESHIIMPDINIQELEKLVQ